MQTLLVEKFSCIAKAEISFASLTLLIGPQASGKSVLCKLAYFFLNAAHTQSAFILKGMDLEKFQANTKQQFFEWFPPNAWGFEPFKIEFRSGNYAVTVSRSTYNKKILNDIRIRFSREFKDQYEALTKISKNAPKEANSIDADFRSMFEFDWKMSDASRNSLSNLMDIDYYSEQIFIPAGRSFFTSLDKAISIFEHARSIDPLILRFGRLYNSLRESKHYIDSSPTERSQRMQIIKSLENLFGGSVVKENDIEYVQTLDGRKVRLTSLSSGQQELFPLLTTLPYVLHRGGSALCFIEEPEAHLFPKAQSRLVETLITVLSAGTRRSNGLVLTTHSPYVLAKINNLIKAGSIGRRSAEYAKEVDKLISRRYWLRGRSVRAYSIEDGFVKPIMGDDNLVNADYLDQISNEIAEEFDSLLNVEAQIAWRL